MPDRLTDKQDESLLAEVAALRERNQVLERENAIMIADLETVTAMNVATDRELDGLAVYAAWCTGLNTRYMQALARWLAEHHQSFDAWQQQARHAHLKGRMLLDVYLKECREHNPD